MAGRNRDGDRKISSTQLTRMPENGNGRIFGVEGGRRSMNSKTVGNTEGCMDRSWNRVQGDGVGVYCRNRRNARKGITNHC